MDLNSLEELLPKPHYASAMWPYPIGSTLRRVKCSHCAEECGVTRWDHWNGFLSACPKCGFLIGRRWQIRTLLWGSLILNAFSFFFTMRPRLAMRVAAVWVGLWVGGGYLVSNNPGVQFAEPTYYTVALFGPVLINALILVRHQVDFDATHPNSTQP